MGQSAPLNRSVELTRENDSLLDAIETLTALLANGLACRNWLASEHPDLERVRQSVDSIVRDSNTLIAAMSQRRPHLPLPADHETGSDGSSRSNARIGV
jgi:hypothetical protein